MSFVLYVCVINTYIHTVVIIVCFARMFLYYSPIHDEPSPRQRLKRHYYYIIPGIE